MGPRALFPPHCSRSGTSAAFRALKYFDLRLSILAPDRPDHPARQDRARARVPTALSPRRSAGCAESCRCWRLIVGLVHARTGPSACRGAALQGVLAVTALLAWVPACTSGAGGFLRWRRRSGRATAGRSAKEAFRGGIVSPRAGVAAGFLTGFDRTGRAERKGPVTSTSPLHDSARPWGGGWAHRIPVRRGGSRWRYGG
jgi:hypothetical protein